MSQNIGQEKKYPLLDSAGTHGEAPLHEGFQHTIDFNVPVGFVGPATFTVEHGAADPLDQCKPDATSWVSASLVPQCDDPTGSVATDVMITIAATQAGQICSYAYPMCGAAFVRLIGAANGITAQLNVGRLRRVG